MTTQWRLQAYPFASGTDGLGVITTIIGQGGSSLLSSTTARMKFYTEYTCSDLRVEMTTLDGNTSGSTVTLKDDGSDTTVSVTVTSTGWTEDLTDSATPAADSIVFYETTNAGGMHGDTLRVASTLMTIEHASINAPILGGGILANWATTQYLVMGSGNTPQSTESEVRNTFQRAATISNLRVQLRTASTPNFDFQPNKNATPSTNLSVNILDIAAYEDVTGSDTYASGDTASFGLVRVSGSAGLSAFQVDSDTPETWLTVGNATVSSTRSTHAFTGETSKTALNDNHYMRIGSVSAGNLETFVSTAGSGTRDISLRVGTTNSTNLTINVTGTGYLTDLTGSESIADDDSVKITAIAQTTSMVYRYVAIECPWTDTGGPAAARRVMITSS